MIWLASAGAAAASATPAAAAPAAAQQKKKMLERERGRAEEAEREAAVARRRAATAARAEATLWVQCTRKKCGKWRILPPGARLPGEEEDWLCTDHPDPAKARAPARHDRTVREAAPRR